MPCQSRKLGIRPRARKDLAISFGDCSTALALEGSRDHRSTAVRLARGDSVIDELDQLVWQPDGDPLAHPNMVSIGTT
jgi:hypothetical protein